MKSRFLMCFSAITLFGALAMPFQSAAQDNKNNHKHHHYKLIDIGTFGGPESFVVPDEAIGSPNPVNRRGTTVGGAATSISTTTNSNPVLCGGEAGVPFVNHAFEVKKNGAMTDLGSLAGDDDCSLGTSINERGEIAGGSENGVVDPLLGFNELRAVRWKDGTMQDLGTLPGGSHSMAAGINNHGLVVGFALNGTSDSSSMFYFQIFGSSVGTQTRAVLWDRNNGVQDLGTLGGNDAWGDFVNEHGQVAGFSYTTSRPNPSTGLPTTHPFLWEKGKGMTDLGTLGGTSAGSEIINMQGALNNLGHIVGGSKLSGDQTFHPFFWKKGKRMKDLGTLGGKCGTATGINDADEVVGRADVSGPCGHLADALPGTQSVTMGNSRIVDDTGNGDPSATYVSHAFLWKPGMKKLKDLGTVNPDTVSFAHAINESGQVVGLSATLSGSVNRAFLWENGGPMVDLNALISPNSSLYLNWAFAINDRGEIAGVGTPQGCSDGWRLCGHAFVLIPCDENKGDGKGCEEGTQSVSPVPQLSPVSRDVFSGTQRLSPPSRTNRFRFPGHPTGPTN